MWQDANPSMSLDTLRQLSLQMPDWERHVSRSDEAALRGVEQERKYARAELLRPEKWKHERFAVDNPFDGPFRRFAHRFPVELRAGTILCTGQSFGPAELRAHRHAMWFRIGLGDTQAYGATGHTFVLRTSRRLRLVPWTGQGVYPTRSADKQARLEYGRYFQQRHVKWLLHTQPWAPHVPNLYGDLSDSVLREVASRMYPGFDGMVAYVRRLRMYEVVLFDVVGAGLRVVQASARMSAEDVERLRDPSINPSRTMRWWHDVPARTRLWKAKVPRDEPSFEELLANLRDPNFEHSDNMQTDDEVEVE